MLNSLTRLRGARVDLHGRGHARREDHTLWNVVDVDAHRDALRQAHPSEDRVDLSQPCPVWLRVRNVNGACDAVDMTANDLTVAHQLDAGGVADPDRLEVRFLEIAVDPE